MLFSAPTTPISFWIPVALVTILVYLRRNSRHKRPPGPRGVPFLGNLLQLNRPELWLQFSSWKEQYGPITYVSLAGQPIVILNTYKVASELLDRRADIYSDRPRNIVIEMATKNASLTHTTYGELWRTLRRAVHEAFHKESALRFHSMQEKEALLLTSNILDDPSNWIDALGKSSGSFVLSLVYDHPPLKSVQDPIFVRMKEFLRRMEHAAYPGNYLVEFFPWMQYLPSSIAKWKRDIEDWYKKDIATFEGWFKAVERRMLGGDERPSLCAILINGQNRTGLKTADASFLAATMFAVGVDTSTASMAWFIHSMVLHPDVQQKAQEEIDRVVGRSRLPTLADKGNLPYVQALIKELLRLSPVVPLGVPHASVQDDWYAGYFIPKGTICIANSWSMNRDPDIYGPDADEFKPTRHLSDTNTSLLETKGEGHVTFGFGKRVCVGRHVVLNTLFINIATILWALSISPVRNPEGQFIVPDMKVMGDGLVERPRPFKCTIVPRSPEVPVLLAQSMELSA